MSEPVTLQDIYDLFRAAQQKSERVAPLKPTIAPLNSIVN
jgi:hypothetical protein